VSVCSGQADKAIKYLIDLDLTNPKRNETIIWDWNELIYVVDSVMVMSPELKPWCILTALMHSSNEEDTRKLNELRYCIFPNNFSQDQYFEKYGGYKEAINALVHFFTKTEFFATELLEFHERVQRLNQGLLPEEATPQPELESTIRAAGDQATAKWDALRLELLAFDNAKLEKEMNFFSPGSLPSLIYEQHAKYHALVAGNHWESGPHLVYYLVQWVLPALRHRHARDVMRPLGVQSYGRVKVLPDLALKPVRVSW
jgi:hypothetical protein